MPVLDRLVRPRASIAYHGVGEVSDADDPATLVVSTKHLTEQVDALVDRGYRFLTASQVVELGGDPGPGTAILTFDDGWASALTEVVPMLQARGLPATFYVCPGWWDGQHPDVVGPAGRLLGRSDVVALAAAGMEIGSHTLTHPDLRSLDDQELARQLVSSRDELEQLLDRPCRTFAHPFGLHDDRVDRAVEAAGYDLAWGWLPGPWSTMGAPRLPAPCRHGAGRLLLKLRGVRRHWIR